MRYRIAFAVLRISLGVVFLIFGIGKFTNDYWARTMAALPFIEHLPWPAHYSVLGVGALEVVTALALISGFFIRIASAAAALQLLAILIILGFQEVRDIGLLGAALFLAVSAGKGVK